MATNDQEPSRYTVSHINNRGPVAGFFVTCTAISWLAAATCCGPADAAWTSQLIDATAPNSSSVSIAVPSIGRTCVCYQNAATNALLYATNAYGTPSWTSEPVDAAATDIAQAPSLAVDSSGVKHISYYSQFFHDIRQATDASGTWQAQSTGVGAANTLSAITVDANKHVHIAATDGSLCYVTDVTGSLVKTSLQDALHNSIAADQVYSILVSPAGKVYIVYSNANTIYIVTNASGWWVPQALGGAAMASGPLAAAAVDANGYIHVAFLGNSNVLKYTTNASGSWPATATTVDTLAGSAGFSTSISAADASHVTIVYYNPVLRQVDQATYNGTTWQVQQAYTLPGSAGSAGTGITMDTAGSAYLAYFDGAGNLYLATNNTAGAHGADLAVTQAVTPNGSPIPANQNITFTVTVTNHGPDDATGVSLIDQLPAGSTLVSAAASIGTTSQDTAAGTITWNIDSLATGHSAQLSVVVKMAPSGGSAANKATVSSGTGPAGQGDFEPDNNVSSTSVTVQAAPQHQLLMSVATGGSGGSTPGGTLAAANGQTLQYEGSTVTVVATPDSGYRVKQWYGTINDASKSNENAVVIGTTDTSVQVTFEEIPIATKWTLVASVSGGHGTVSPTSGSYDEGTIVTLTATPDRHYAVRAWSGTNNDGSTDNVNAVTMNASRMVSVQFQQVANQPPQAVATDPSQNHYYYSGDSVTLDGSQSFDPEGGPLTYSWEQVSGPTVNLNDPSAAVTKFTAPSVNSENAVQFDLTVTDDMGLESTDRIPVIIEPKSLDPGSGMHCGQAAGVPLFASLCWIGLTSWKWGRRRM